MHLQIYVKIGCLLPPSAKQYILPTKYMHIIYKQCMFRCSWRNIIHVRAHCNLILNAKTSTGPYSTHDHKTRILFTMGNLSNFKEFIIKLNYSKNMWNHLKMTSVKRAKQLLFYFPLFHNRCAGFSSDGQGSIWRKN